MFSFILYGISYHFFRGIPYFFLLFLEFHMLLGVIFIVHDVEKSSVPESIHNNHHCVISVQNEIYYYLSFNLYFLLQRCIKFSVYSLHDFNSILSCDERIISRYFFPFFLSIFDIIIIVVNSFSCLYGV